MNVFWWSAVAAGEKVRPKFYYTDPVTDDPVQVWDVTTEIDRLLNIGYTEISALSAKEMGLPT